MCCVDQVKEELVRLLLPYLMAGLGPDITADYRAASLMILTQLATQATLSDTLVTGQQETSGRPTHHGIAVWFIQSPMHAGCCNADDETSCRLLELVAL